MSDIATMIPRRFYTIDGVERLVTNLTANVNISSETQRSVSLFLDYTVKPRETARTICSRLYEDPDLYWTIYLVNGITNSIEEWPRLDFDAWKRQRYTEAELSEVKTYSDVDRNSVDLLGIRSLYGFDDTTPTDAEIVNTFNLKPVTLDDMLDMEEEKKRRIRLIDPDYIDDFVEVVREALK